MVTFGLGCASKLNAWQLVMRLIAPEYGMFAFAPYLMKNCCVVWGAKCWSVASTVRSVLKMLRRRLCKHESIPEAWAMWQHPVAWMGTV